MTDELVEIAARALAAADRIEICLGAQYRHSSYGIRANSVLTAVTPQIEARVTADIVAWLRSASKHNWLAGPYDAAITAEALADAADAIERGDHRSQP